ncbi:RHS repeat domain-containing protein, partial [Porphyromonas macacae]
EGDWAYEWQGNGMLKSVKRPDGETVSFKYDPLGRRISKTYQDRTTRWVWDGNVPLHEWTDEEDITTWVFEEGSFVPCAKLQNGESYSIITDYPGTPTEMYNSKGKKTWSAELDIYGCVRTFRGRSLSDCPFRYQGQYEDEETGLYYNRFRYYDPNAGNYISQDPIGLVGGISLYEYSKNTNIELAPFGLADFYVTPNGTVVPATGYRYVSSEAPYLDELKATKTIPANPNGTYISFDNFDTPNPGALQVPHDASVKLSFDTLQIVDDLEIPKRQWGKADYLEPITKDFPEFGRGGATQAITHKEIKVDKIESLKHH